MQKKERVDQQIKEIVAKAISVLFPSLAYTVDQISLEHPAAPEHGDYATNVALAISKSVSKQPPVIAKELVEKIRGNSSEGVIFDRVEVGGAGFINFWLSSEWLVRQIQEVRENGERYGSSQKTGKKIAIELVSPNINKPLHIGHLRNGALGMSLAETYKMIGWEVVRDEINNDRGLHIMKSALGYLLFGQKNKQETNNWQDLLDLWASDQSRWLTPREVSQKPDYFVGEYYVQGENYLEQNGDLAKGQLSEMLQAWEKEEPKIWKLWKVMSDWVHEGIDATYKRIGVEHDKRWYEHLLYREGKEIILKASEKGIFEKLPDGAVQANLEKYHLPNKILVRSDGTAIYMTFDIALTGHKVAEFEADKYVWVVGNDQIDHFKRLFAIFEMLGLGSIDKFYHLAHGMVRVPGGKMSSRLGNVILADDLLDKMKEMVLKLMAERKIGAELADSEKELIAEAVGVGAAKYTMLKVNPMLDVTFDLEKSVSLEGDSGPYLQYTYTRARSVLRKAQGPPHKEKAGVQADLTAEELAVLRFIYRFPEVVEQAAKTYSPNLICTYLFELAKRFNNFYNNIPILKSHQENFRVSLVEATAIVLKNGLSLLGIMALEKM